MSFYREMFKEDFSDIVKKVDTLQPKLTFYERVKKFYNYKLERHLDISEYELWMLSKLSYSNDGVKQKFIDKHYNKRFIIKEFISEVDGLQFYVIESKLTKDVIIAFRGTDEFVDWLTNVQILSKKSRQFNTAKKSLENILTRYHDYNIYFCGHSLGGALAQEMHLYFYSFTNLNLVKTATFNSAGVRLKGDKAYPNLPIYNYIILKDIVGNSTGYHYGKVYYVNIKNNTNKLSPIKLMAHSLDQFTFNLKGNVNIILDDDQELVNIN